MTSPLFSDLLELVEANKRDLYFALEFNGHTQEGQWRVSVMNKQTSFQLRTIVMNHEEVFGVIENAIAQNSQSWLVGLPVVDKSIKGAKK